MELNKFYWSV